MIPVEQSNPQKKGDQLINFLPILKDVTEVIWEAENYDIPRERFYYTIFMKLQFLLDAMHLQIYNLDHKPQYCLAAGLSLRTCMLDVLNLYYVMDVHEDHEATTFRINQLMSDQLKKVYKELKKEEKDIVRKKWAVLFDEMGKLIVFPRMSSSTYINSIKRVNNFQEEAKRAFHIYDLFSKYEHNGAFTFDLLHNPFTDKGIEIIKSKIFDAIDITAIACKYISSHWLDEHDPLTVKLDLALKNLLQVDHAN